MRCDNRSTMLVIGWALLLTSAWNVGPAKATDPPAKPLNVLFLICDDLNCDLGCYGHGQVKSPNIDALAARGVRFANCHCQYPLCGPSRASFMTGLYPDQTGVKQNAIYLRERMPRVKTMTQHFREAGYLATRVGKIYHYNVPRNIGTSGHDDPDSWNLTFNPRGRDVADEPKIFSLRPGSFGGTLSWLAADGEDHEQTDGIAAKIAVERLKYHAEQGDPFFLAVGLYRPHTPFVAPRKYFDQYPLNEIEVPAVPDKYLESLPAPAAKSITRMKVQVNLEAKLAKQAIQAYRASITFADAQIGIILDALEDTGLASNTIVLFTSDHGYHMGEHGHWQKSTLFENATHVPLIIAAPGMAKGQMANTLVEMIDFYPTLSELAGLKIPTFVAGRSLVPALKNPQATVRDSSLTLYQDGYSLRTERYRFSRWGEEGQLGEELYDVAADPEELVNLAGRESMANIQQQLRKTIIQRIDEAQTLPQGMRTNEIRYQRVLPLSPKKKKGSP